MNTLPERISSKIRITSSCWVWNGRRHGNYGSVHYKGRDQRAHRAVYMILRGEIPEGLVIDHLCRNTYCVNPDHLEPVTQRENILRGISPQAIYARRTHCDKGHEFTEENTFIRPENNSRRCKICLRQYQRDYQRKNKDKVKKYQKTYATKHPEVKRRYAEQNREKLLDYWKEYNKTRPPRNRKKGSK